LPAASRRNSRLRTLSWRHVVDRAECEPRFVVTTHSLQQVSSSVSVPRQESGFLEGRYALTSGRASTSVALSDAYPAPVMEAAPFDDAHGWLSGLSQRPGNGAEQDGWCGTGAPRVAAAWDRFRAQGASAAPNDIFHVARASLLPTNRTPTYWSNGHPRRHWKPT
jgi:hypothetical protein